MEHQCYVETDAHSATVRMPSVVAEMHKAHLARLQRIKVAAIGEKAKAAAKANDSMVEMLELALEEQQAPKHPWFSVVEMGEADDAVKRPLLVEEIQRAACRYFKVTRNDMLSPRRDKRVAHPRHIAMYLAKTLTPRSLPEIGRRFGGRDHTTILHGVRKIQALVLSDWEVAHDVAHVEGLL